MRHALLAPAPCMQLQREMPTRWLAAALVAAAVLASGAHAQLAMQWG